MQDKPTAVEIKFANYFRSDKNDYVLAKVVEHYADGRKVPALREFKNFERSFYITRPPYRNHTQKKECEFIDKLQEFKCRQMDLIPAISKALGYRGKYNGTLKQLCRSPYVYHVDLTSPSIIVNTYRKKYPDAVTPYSVAVLDIETNVLDGTDEPIIVSATFGNKAILSIDKHWLGRENCVKSKVIEACKKYEGDLIESRNIDIEVYFGEHAGDISQYTISKINEWMPDFVCIWNIEFDIGKILACLEKYGYNPADVFSHPSVPKEFRKAYLYLDDKPQRKMVGGKEKMIPKDHMDRWNFLYTPSASVYLCGMRIYGKHRVAAEGKSAEGYGLDATLKKHINRAKVKIAGIEHLEKLHFHRVAQQHYKLDYIAYNLGDCVELELLQEKLLDLPVNIGNFIGVTEYKNYFSQTKKASDEMHLLHLEYGQPLCATSDQMVTDLDMLTYGKGKEEDRDGWIAMLASYKTYPTHKEFFKGSGLPCMIRRDTADSDAEGTYPSLEEAFNIAQQNIMYEMVKVEHLTLSEQMMMGIDVTGGSSNAALLLNTIYQVPPFQEVLNIFKADHGLD
jgi:hypothetical protein